VAASRVPGKKAHPKPLELQGFKVPGLKLFLPNLAGNETGKV
jgi:hypothetical protein